MTTLPATGSGPVSTTPPNQVKSKKMELKTEDFIKMMITQLQNQDPLEPGTEPGGHTFGAHRSFSGRRQGGPALLESGGLTCVVGC